MNILIAGQSEKTTNYKRIINYLGYSCTISLDTNVIKNSRFDRVLLPGGGDIHPIFMPHNCSIQSLLYHNTKKTESQVDLAQFLILDYSVKHGIPILGICKGMQLINVYFGGSILDNRQTTPYHISPKSDVVHETLVNPNSILGKIYHKELASSGTLVVNSSHHQIINHLASCLDCIQISCKDKICEAFIHKNLPILGLQWHPERMCHTMPNIHTVDGTPVYKYFLSSSFHTS